MTVQEMGNSIQNMMQSAPPHLKQQIAQLYWQWGNALQAQNAALDNQIYQQIYSLIASQSSNQNVWQSMWQSIQPYAAQAFAFVGLAWSTFSSYVSGVMGAIAALIFTQEFLVFMLCVMVLVLAYYLFIHLPNQRRERLQQQNASRLRAALCDPNYGPVVGIMTKMLPPAVKIEFA